MRLCWCRNHIFIPHVIQHWWNPVWGYIPFVWVVAILRLKLNLPREFALGYNNRFRITPRFVSTGLKDLTFLYNCFMTCVFTYTLILSVTKHATTTQHNSCGICWMWSKCVTTGIPFVSMLALKVTWSYYELLSLLTSSQLVHKLRLCSAWLIYFIIAAMSMALTESTSDMHSKWLL